MNSPKKPVSCLVAILVLLLIPAFSNAAPRFVITPKVAASWQFDTNYYAADENELKVATYIFQPGIDLGIETPKSSLILNYTLDLHYFDDWESISAGQQSADDDDFVGHTLNLESRHKPFDRLLVGLDNSFYRTREQGYSDAFSNAVDRDLYYINRLTPLAIYEFGAKFSLATRYRYTVLNYNPQ